MDRMPHLTIINSLSLCEGTIIRMRKTTRGVEKNILDVFVTCNRILPYITRMHVDENREKALTNFSAIKQVGRVIESDHNVETLEVNLEFSNVKSENREWQLEFKKLT